MSLTEKDLSVDSQDEDSGHDSADSLSAGPVDDRERIVHLETAVAWIKEEMVSPSVEVGLLLLFIIGAKETEVWLLPCVHTSSHEPRFCLRC